MPANAYQILPAVFCMASGHDLHSFELILFASIIKICAAFVFTLLTMK